MSAKPNKNLTTVNQGSAPANVTGKKKGTSAIPSWAPMAVVVITAVLYSHALQNGFTFDDDDIYILKNPFIHDFTLHGIKNILTSFYSYNYHPLTTLAWLLEYKWFRLDPYPYHLFNVLLHVGNTWLVFKLTTGLSGKKLTGIFVSLLFAIHPMHVESVAWISELKDVLYSFFYLLSLLAYLHYVDDNKRATYYIATLLLFVASLCSKSAAVTLPVLMLAIDVYKGRRRNTSLLTEKIPFFLLAVVFGILAILSQRSGGAINDITLSYGYLNKLFLFTSGIAGYLISLVAPLDLCALHFFPNLSGGMLPWYYYFSLPFVVACVWMLAWPPKRYRLAGIRKEIIFGLCFFGITISVMLQVITVGSSVTAERYTYMPYIGLFYVAGQWFTGLWESGKRTIPFSLLSFITVLFSVLAWNRIEVWKDTDILFTDIVEKNPGNQRNYLVYYYWGNSKKYESKPEEAKEKYSKAITLNPKYYQSYTSRGLIYEMTRDIPAALADYNYAIALNPKLAAAYNYRGWALHESGDKKSAILDFNKAISLDSNYTEAYNNRGWTRCETGDTLAGMNDYNKAIALSPTYLLPYLNRAAVKAGSGNFLGAIDDYNALLKLYPTDSLVYFNRGSARFNSDDKTGACEDWKKANDLGYTAASQLLKQYCH